MLSLNLHSIPLQVSSRTSDVESSTILRTECFPSPTLCPFTEEEEKKNKIWSYPLAVAPSEERERLTPNTEIGMPRSQSGNCGWWCVGWAAAEEEEQQWERRIRARRKGRRCIFVYRFHINSLWEYYQTLSRFVVVDCMQSAIYGTSLLYEDVDFTLGDSVIETLYWLTR